MLRMNDDKTNVIVRSRNFQMSEVRKLKARFQKARPYPHIGISSFLKDPKPVFSAIKSEQFFKKDSDLFSFSQTNNLFYSKNPVMQSAVKLFSSQTFSSLISAISGIKLKHGALDVFGSLYEKTGYLLCHDDRVEDRKIAFILYLSTLAEKDGGALALYSNKRNHPYQKINSYPLIENSLFIFKVSKVSWHEVEEVIADKKRYAIGGWLH